MTLAEFMHPLKRASRRAQVQAALFWSKHYENLDETSVADVRRLLTRARIPNARAFNVPQILSRSVPNVHQAGERGFWAITETGERRLIDEFALRLPDAAATTDVATLERLAEAVTDEATRDYINEAVRCHRAGARRASVVFLWSGAVAALRETIWKYGASTIEARLQVHNPKARFKKQADFAYVKDADLIQVAQDIELFDKSQKKRLGEALDLRNDCGHPVKYRPGEHKVSSFIEDVVGIVWS